MPENYSEFFKQVTSHQPLPYQERLAEDPFTSKLLIVPTGLGKTDAVLVPWIYAQCYQLPAPTRLAMVLPRQNLTSQTACIVRERLHAADLDGIEVMEMLGGSDDNHRVQRPDRPAVIVATQDLFFSRALNRGYARRPQRWPVDFALYNQDCLIVLDEIQLMDDALATSTQLAAFRRKFGIFGDAPCIWMSATVNPDWLRTVDSPTPPEPKRLDERDFENALVRKRLHATKVLAPAPESCRTPAGCASFALEKHKPGTRTLVIANTVPRAREICAAIRPEFPGVILLHSRFRREDRRTVEALLNTNPPEGQIIVATQVLEAGVDLTARRMITDIAPWGSLVQRFGRVNRYGDDEQAEIWWVDQPAYSKSKDPFLPYSSDQVEQAAARLAGLASASPADLPGEDGPAAWRYVLRRADLLDLFDTSTDLAGNDLDVSRFIRATEDKDAYLAWREWAKDCPPPNAPEIADAELCPAPIGDLREFARKHALYAWNFASEEWVEADRDRIVPGMVLLTRSSEGGYTARDGWFPESKAKVEPIPPPDGKEMEGDSSDPGSYPGYRQLLRKHSDRVGEEMEALLLKLPQAMEWAPALRAATAKHDWGKAHRVFQETMHRNDRSDDLLAKQEGHARHRTPHFRHELASALAMLQTGESDLSAYLAAAHHGKVRMSIRSMPGEGERDGMRMARGIQDGDTLPGCELGTGIQVPPVTLSLAPMEMGGAEGSWSDRMIGLLETLGPFRLAYLETLLRAADSEASKESKLEEAACTN
jgi:CRISPR-associated endonuclease/helicase Cas3